MVDEEVLLVLNLFDSNWFGHKISTEKPNQDQEKTEELDGHDFLVPQNLKVRSLSEQILDSKMGSSFFSSENSLSPSSAWAKLETIFSGKEAKYEDQEEAKEEVLPEKKKKKKKRVRERKRRINKGVSKASKSLSELEFEELKGFMDLGFVFTEKECKDSKLVSMIPGLQRYCKKCTHDHHQHIKSEDHHDDHDHDHDEVYDDDDDDDADADDSHKGVISRPYLSEAWDVLEQREKKEETVKPLVVIDWKIPATLGNEIHMKDQLRFWAHTVASTVR